MKFIVLYISLFICGISISQNLVPNPSFETYTVCPNSVGQIESSTPWTAATTDNSSTDYYNACSASSSLGVPYNQGGFQYARTGNAYAGVAFCLNTGLREYLQVQLTNPLVQNTTYHVEFYINSSNSSVNSNCNNIAANLSVNRPYTTSQGVLQTLTPHIMNPGNPVVTDTLNWMQVSACYIAQGGEEYITIGNFFDNSNTQVGATGVGYYYVDDVKVEAISGTCVNGIIELLANHNLKVYPNPNNGTFSIAYTFEQAGQEFVLFNLMGKEVKRIPLENNEGVKQQNNTDLNNGIYLYKVLNSNKVLFTGKLIVNN